MKIFSKWKTLWSNGFSYGLMKLFARIPAIRAVVQVYYKLLYPNVNNLNDLFESNNFLIFKCHPKEIIKSLHSKGFSMGVSLSKSAVDEVMNYAVSTPSYAYMNPAKGFMVSDRISAEANLGSEILISHYCDLYRDCLVIKSISDSDELLAIAKSYLGTSRVKRIASQLWWTFPVIVDDRVRSRFAHFYHRDLDGWAFLKVFFYITPVETNEGAHYYVEKSHRPGFTQILREKFRINRHTDDVISSWYGRAVEMTGPAGAGIIEDTYGLHKGQTPKSKARLIFCLVYGMDNYNGIQEFNTLGVKKDLI